MVSVKAHFDGRAIIPDEPIELPCNQDLIIHVQIPRPEVKLESALDWAIENAVEEPAVPQDLSHEHDHYLYGTPRKRD